mmetsp:Transcript_52086/g.110787  ORF Transcript_52086/g.110787 Transcript_52086/m.110787 type:complete len:220 (+) Transcript_52086:220-879(+)
MLGAGAEPKSGSLLPPSGGSIMVTFFLGFTTFVASSWASMSDESSESAAPPQGSKVRMDLLLSSEFPFWFLLLDWHNFKHKIMSRPIMTAMSRKKMSQPRGAGWSLWASPVATPVEPLATGVTPRSPGLASATGTAMAPIMSHENWAPKGSSATLSAFNSRTVLVLQHSQGSSEEIGCKVPAGSCQYFWSAGTPTPGPFSVPTKAFACSSAAVALALTN